MNKIYDIVLPDEDIHFRAQLIRTEEYDGKGVYQIQKWRRCIPYIKQFRHALDVGAHVGLWSRVLAYHFEHITAFEPCTDFWGLWETNMKDHDKSKYKLKTIGLSESNCMKYLQVDKDNSGKTHVTDSKEGLPAYFYKLDDCKNIHDVDFIKLDCEGYEYFALKGAEQTIKKYKPFVLVEQKPGNGSRYGVQDISALDLLTSWGGKQVFEMHHDYGFWFE